MTFFTDLGNFGGFFSQNGTEAPDRTPADPELDEPKGRKRAHRRTAVCLELTQKYEYKRAHSEVRLLESLNYKPLQNGHSYNFLTAGDIDALSYLKVAMNGRNLDRLLIASLVMTAEDWLQITQWYDAGRIAALDLCLSDLFFKSYKIELQMVNDFYAAHPQAGSLRILKAHCKVMAGCNEAEGFYFGIQSSANFTTNPRIENACITVDRGIYDFYRDFFASIREG